MSKFKKVEKKEENKNLSNIEIEIKNNKKNNIFIAKKLIETSNNLVKDKNNMIYEYNNDEKIYKLLQDQELKDKLFVFFETYAISDLWNTSKINSIISAIKSCPIIKEVELDNYPDFIALKNGILDINTLKIIQYSKDYYFTSIIEKIEYKKIKELKFYKILNSSEHFASYLFSTFDGDIDTIKNIAMIGGCLLSISFKTNKFFILNGNGANGKSILINIIEKFFNKNQRSALSLKQIAGTGHERETLINSRINLTTEDEGDYVSAKEIKKITDRENVTINPKYKTPYTFKLKTKVILATNSLPKFKDNTDGLSRRLCIIDFKNQFKRKGEYDLIKNPNRKNIYIADNSLEDKIIKDEMSNVLNFFIWGLRKLQKDNNWEFIMGKNFLGAIEKYKKNANSFYEFAVDTYILNDDLDEIHWISAIEIKREYDNWYNNNIQNNSSSKLGTNVMGRNLKNIFKCEQKTLYKSLNGETKQRLSCYPLIKINDKILIENNEKIKVNKDLFNN